MDVPVDGFTVAAKDGDVLLVLSGRYGTKDAFRLDPASAALIGTTLCVYAVESQTWIEEEADAGTP